MIVIIGSESFSAGACQDIFKSDHWETNKALTVVCCEDGTRLSEDDMLKYVNSSGRKVETFPVWAIWAPRPDISIVLISLNAKGFIDVEALRGNSAHSCFSTLPW